MSAKSNLLTKKTITVASTRRSCICCSGSGSVAGQTLNASRFKNLKVSGSITIENECNVCHGTGIVLSTVRKVLRRDRNRPVVI